MIKFPMFDTIYFSKDLCDVFLKNCEIGVASELRGILGINKNFKIIPEESLPENHGIFVQRKIVVAIYVNGRIHLVPKRMRNEYSREKFIFKNL